MLFRSQAAAKVKKTRTTAAAARTSYSPGDPDQLDGHRPQHDDPRCHPDRRLHSTEETPQSAAPHGPGLPRWTEELLTPPLDDESREVPGWEGPDRPHFPVDFLPRRL